MSRIQIYLYVCGLFCIGLSSCNNVQNRVEKKYPVHVTWTWHETNGSEMSGHRASFRISNQSIDTIQGNWEFYFNTLFLSINSSVKNDSFHMQHISGDLWKIYPKDSLPIYPGTSIDIAYESSSLFFKNVQAPHGFYMVWNKDPETARRIQSYEIKGIDISELAINVSSSQIPIPTASYLYEKNKELEELEDWHIIPTPQVCKFANEFGLLSSNTLIVAPGLLQNESNYLNNYIQFLLNDSVTVRNSVDDAEIAVVNLTINEELASEAYEMIYSENQINISGGSPKGVFYGIQSLIALFPIEAFTRKNDQVRFRLANISDAPAFPYRGVHIDVARNFHNVGTIKKIIDLLAFYKINTLHFHLTNDEGWRLEIPGLPELTDIGAARGHSLQETDYLLPYYGTGPELKRQYYSTDDFKSILKYAHSRHIEVIPEVSVPGHARAAILAMRKRYYKYMQEGNREEAEKFLLDDLTDKSEYISVQNFRENTVNVCIPSVYRFFEVVIDAIIQMYKEAEVPLRTIHTGGDEVPDGCWTASPVCEKLFDQSPNLKGVKDLPEYFLLNIESILRERGLRLAGWEEIAEKPSHSDNSHGSFVTNNRFATSGFLVYIWNSVAGWGSEDVAYQLANAGYDVVICNSSNLYFDLAYDLHPDERGHTWSGFIDTRTAWSILPFDIFLSNDSDMFGNPIDPAQIKKGKTLLQEEAKSRIKGLQGQLWSETIYTGEQMEYYLFPRLTGLAERAWKGQPHWGDIADSKIRNKERLNEWNRFANSIGKRDLPRSDYLFNGFNGRIPRPGAQLMEGKLYANIEYPGLIIRFTTDGSTPDEWSTVYKGPIQISSKTIHLRAFTPSGRGGGITIVTNQ
ncbi:MAG TPA: family 20 glycosylhydrolase [Saprospiraceae bacterium]|nr:family 20 glycosylhydrolase [Saprospiraceae bacterium]